MTQETNTPGKAPELDTASLDQVVGGGIAMPDARNQEQEEKKSLVRKAGEGQQKI